MSVFSVIVLVTLQICIIFFERAKAMVQSDFLNPHLPQQVRRLIVFYHIKKVAIEF
jgi:hypothetical protein